MSDWKIRFGTAGTSDSFAAQGYKTSLDVPEYTAQMGLDAFEYQCGRGVRLGLDKAAKMAAGMSLANNASLAVDEECYFSKVHKEDRERVRAAYRNLIEGHTEKVCEEFRVVSNESGHWHICLLYTSDAADD